MFFLLAALLAAPAVDGPPLTVPTDDAGSWWPVVGKPAIAESPRTVVWADHREGWAGQGWLDDPVAARAWVATGANWSVSAACTGNTGLWAPQFALITEGAGFLVVVDDGGVGFTTRGGPCPQLAAEGVEGDVYAVPALNDRALLWWRANGRAEGRFVQRTRTSLSDAGVVMPFRSNVVSLSVSFRPEAYRVSAVSSGGGVQSIVGVPDQNQMLQDDSFMAPSQTVQVAARQPGRLPNQTDLGLVTLDPSGLILHEMSGELGRRFATLMGTAKEGLFCFVGPASPVCLLQAGGGLIATNGFDGEAVDLGSGVAVASIGNAVVIRNADQTLQVSLVEFANRLSLNNVVNSLSQTATTNRRPSVAWSDAGWLLAYERQGRGAPVGELWSLSVDGGLRPGPRLTASAQSLRVEPAPGGAVYLRAVLSDGGVSGAILENGRWRETRQGLRNDIWWQGVAGGLELRRDAVGSLLEDGNRPLVLSGRPRCVAAVNGGWVLPLQGPLMQTVLIENRTDRRLTGINFGQSPCVIQGPANLGVVVAGADARRTQVLAEGTGARLELPKLSAPVLATASGRLLIAGVSDNSTLTVYTFDSTLADAGVYEIRPGAGVVLSPDIAISPDGREAVLAWTLAASGAVTTQYSFLRFDALPDAGSGSGGAGGATGAGGSAGIGGVGADGVGGAGQGGAAGPRPLVYQTTCASAPAMVAGLLVLLKWRRRSR